MLIKPKGSPFYIFRHYETVQTFFRFFQKFFISPKVPFNFFYYFATSWIFKKLKGPLSTIFTLAISKCYGKVRVLFFPRDNSLVSDRKSHNSDFFGLAVRCLLFNPEGPGSNPCLCAIFFTKFSKQKILTFFDNMRPPSPFSAF